MKEQDEEQSPLGYILGSVLWPNVWHDNTTVYSRARGSVWLYLATVLLFDRNANVSMLTWSE